MAADLPYMPVYVNDIMASPSVQLMTAEERGAYFWLLFVCWSDRAMLPDDAADLAALAKVPTLSDRVRRQFVEHPTAPGRLTNPRLLDEWQKRQQQHQQHVENGRKGAATRWPGYSPANGGANGPANGGANGPANGGAIASQNHNQNHNQKKTNTAGGRARAREDASDDDVAQQGVGAEDWDANEATRRQLGNRLFGAMRSVWPKYLSRDDANELGCRVHDDYGPQGIGEIVGYLRQATRRDGRYPGAAEVIQAWQAGDPAPEMQDDDDNSGAALVAAFERR